MFYECPDCSKKFKYTLDDLTDPAFGHCPDCGAEGKLVAESSSYPENAADYEEV
jgi:peptide subunit release factor 1 (eRF1)